MEAKQRGFEEVGKEQIKEKQGVDGGGKEGTEPVCRCGDTV